ncbi:hypothetical protein CDAR_568361 [Caerostris darwini]|uniref:Uncharacterized protein n=1 Tax=Caerostris darwini TaxID=1538125 RepID=A0AAV4PKE6_9ARAC|nr:hypothetical protein CDAR_568361 [Caerostris darwini]
MEENQSEADEVHESQEVLEAAQTLVDLSAEIYWPVRFIEAYKDEREAVRALLKLSGTGTLEQFTPNDRTFFETEKSNPKNNDPLKPAN